MKDEYDSKGSRRNSSVPGTVHGRGYCVAEDLRFVSFFERSVVVDVTVDCFSRVIDGGGEVHCLFAGVGCFRIDNGGGELYSETFV